MVCSQTQLFKKSAIGCSFHRSETTERRVFTDGELFRYSVGVFLAIAKNPTVIILGFHPRDSGSSPDSGIFFAPARARVCGAFVFWVCARAVRVWGACGAFGVCFVCGGLGQGGGRAGVCGVVVTRVEGGGFDFFLPKKGPTGPVPAGPARPRRDHAGAKARPSAGKAPAPRRRVPQRHLAVTPEARRRSRMQPVVTTTVSQTVE